MIYHWLVEWIRDGILPLKQITTDMPLALLSAVVRAFTQFNNLSTYIQSCFKILENTRIPQELPTCFIRCDVAHTIKLIFLGCHFVQLILE